MNKIAAVVIGRNEGDRLVACLTSLRGRVDHIVYVDSGSTDGSLNFARGLPVEVIELETSVPFTAARARNAGLSRVSGDSTFCYVQFVDGDCEIVEDWISTAANFLDSTPQVGAVAGRLRERYPHSSVYHRLAEAEWSSATGATDAVGGIMMARISAINEVGGFNPALIAGEEPELCLRLRRSGWEIWRLEDDMALHDIAMTQFSQWWKRSKRAGHTYAEGAALYGRGPERYNVSRERRSLLWGAGVPLAALLGALVTPWALLILLLWPLQVLRLRLRGEGWERSVFLTLGKVAEAQGAIGYHLAQLRGRKVRLIEYK